MSEELTSVWLEVHGNWEDCNKEIQDKLCLEIRLGIDAVVANLNEKFPQFKILWDFNS